MALAFAAAGRMAREVLRPRFARQVLSGRWFMLFACLLIMSSSGATYAFGIYSRELRSSMGYDQRAVATLAFFKDLGANVGVHVGLLNEVAPPWLVLGTGAAMNLAGYLMVYLSLAGRVARPPVWLMCAYICAGANSQTFAATGAMVACVSNFPDSSRGALLGLLKGYAGLSSAILAQAYLALYGGGDARSLVLLIAWLPAAVSAAFLGTVRVVPPRRPRQSASCGGGGGDVFLRLLYISVALAAYILVMIVVQRQASFSRAAYAASAAGLLLLLFLPLAVVVRQEYRTNNELEESLLAVPTTVTVVDKATALPLAGPAITPPPPSCPRPGTWLVRTFSPPAYGEDYSIPQALVSVDMVILFVAVGCGTGGTLTAIDNMGQIGQSLGYPPKSVDAFVSLISIWNYSGRVAAGYASEALLARYGLPRPLMITGVLLLSCAGHLLIAAGAPGGTLYAASVLVGFCFGAQWPLLFAAVSELFGLKRYSTLCNISAAASPVGSYALNVLVAGRLYDAEAARQHGGGDNKTCVGVECFGRSFTIIAAATAAGALVSLALAWRTREFYHGDIYARFRDATETTTEESLDGGCRAAEPWPREGSGGGRVNGGQSG